MKRVVLLMEGTHHADKAFKEVGKLCESGDKVVVLCVVKEPNREIVGSHDQVTLNTYTAGTGSLGPRTGMDIPIYETEDDLQDRVSDEVIERLDREAASARKQGIEVFNRVIVRNLPGEEMAEWAREERPSHIAMLKSSSKHLAEFLGRGDEVHVLDGTLAPVVQLSG
jgi:nucleotide-binding universal stress UspA family protein